jgi:hypothetical protein
MMRFLGRQWPVVVAVAVYWTTVAILLLISMALNQQHLAYALDDPYIHMAMARNLAESAVWGVTSRSFSASSSSPLWTLLLATVFFLTGPNLWVPLLLNLLVGTTILIASASMLARFGVTRWWALAVLLVLLFVTPLPALTFVGMEHLLHVLTTLLFVTVAARAVASPTAGRKDTTILFCLAPLSTAIRFESVFMVAIVAFLMIALRRRWLDAVLLLVLGALPIVVNGVVGLANGWYFLPTSILLKAKIPETATLSGLLYTFGYRSLETLYTTPALLFLALGALILLPYHWVRQPAPASRAIAVMSAIFVPMTLVHLQFARLGWFYRYEAYLIALGIVIVAAGLGALPLAARWRERPALRVAWLGYAGAALLIGLLAVPYAVRAARSLATTPIATNNIYQQQVQMGLFLAQYYDDSSVVANDIGAISFFSNSDLLDLWGLGTKETATLIMRDEDTIEATDKLAQQRNSKIAIIYDHGNAPESWLKVGEWTVSSPVTVEPTVSIYAIDPAEVSPLIEHLREFAAQLPPGVSQSGLYTE